MQNEPLYVNDCLKSFPAMEELWEEFTASHREMPALSKEEQHHLSTLLHEYRECKEEMYKHREENLPEEFHQARKKRNKKRKEVWAFCAEHGLPNIIVSNGDKKGLQDLDGNTVLPSIYEEFCLNYDDIEHLFPINYFVCKKDGKWGVVDNHNKPRISFEYDRIFRLVNSPYLFFVEKDGMKGLVKLTPYEVLEDYGKRLPKEKETMTFLIPCEMDEICFIEYKNLFVFCKKDEGGERKYGWLWETTEPNPKSFSSCIYDELYIPLPWTEKSIPLDDDFFEARRGQKFDYILIWNHQC